ncbi:condensin complex subunit 2-like [Gigantopelta aegis]|uniref:condensin complex subunit 2-like n=1 Tax=Gigantopelta aegis TaxID=1735272 RepID=UPI001B88AD21|nr:condensin complex subunit 2-like [Gigantopelta aegis]
MPTRRDVLSPITNTPVGRQHPSQKFISPTTSRHVGLRSPITLLNSVHDDEKERKERRRSRVLDLQRKNLGSPSSPSDRVTPLNGLNSLQLAEHYTNCIKLSAENKINAKNAFGLHLIDYMSELLKKKELENFQVASSTLDASAKIYAGRVDFIHAETYKVLSGLGRGSDKSKNSSQNDDTEADVENVEQEEGQKKKRKAKKSHTVETKLKNINVNKFDLEFEVDPMFHVMSAAFDEVGTSGLLLNNLRCFDDSQQLVLDSSALISVDHDSQKQEERKPISDVAEIKELLQKADFDKRHICPAFSEFKFKDDVTPSAKSQPEFIFDMNAEPEPIPQVEDEFLDVQSELAENLSDGDNPDDDAVYDDNALESNIVGDSRTAQLMHSAFKDLTHGSTGSLLQILASEPSDYSYFNKALLQTWAGPAHWRIGTVSKDSRFKSVNKSQKSKVKKPTFRIEYDETVDFDLKYFKKSKTTILTKRTLNGYSKDQTTLPKDLHYDMDKLFKLFCQPKIMIKRQSLEGVGLDDQITNYDYDNTNDRENFCADLVNDDDDDADNNSNEFDFNFGADSGNCSEASSQNVTEPNLQFDGMAADGTVLCGDKLLAQPYKVAKIDIAYAKTAKKLDVRKLKAAMWNILTVSATQKNNDAEQTEVDISKGLEELSMKEKSMSEQWSFNKMLESLPSHISESAVKNLSVPIAFVCLLHLANEKCLKILDTDMQDLIISQDV